MSTKITFEQWVSEREAAGETKQDVANDLKIAVGSLYRYLANDRVPDRGTMQLIIERSFDRVDVACFYRPKSNASEEGVAA